MLCFWGASGLAIFSFNLYTVICYLCIPRPWRILIPKDTQKFVARIPQDAKNDWLIWRCFCRMSCSCDFCGCPCGCFLKMHISFSLCCALQKNLFYLSGHIKAQAWLIFNLGFLFFFFKWDSLLVHIIICNKITHYMWNLVSFSLFLLCLNSWAKAPCISLSGLYWCRQTSSKFMVNANWL